MYVRYLYSMYDTVCTSTMNKGDRHQGSTMSINNIRRNGFLFRYLLVCWRIDQLWLSRLYLSTLHGIRGTYSYSYSTRTPQYRRIPPPNRRCRIDRNARQIRFVHSRLGISIPSGEALNTTSSKSVEDGLTNNGRGWGNHTTSILVLENSLDWPA